jgi:hypothetical protein
MRPTLLGEGVGVPVFDPAEKECPSATEFFVGNFFSLAVFFLVVTISLGSKLL